MESIVHWLLKDYPEALRALVPRSSASSSATTLPITTGGATALRSSSTISVPLQQTPGSASPLLPTGNPDLQLHTHPLLQCISHKGVPNFS